VGLLITAVACSGGGGGTKKTAPAARMTLSSPAFAENTAIPSQFTCDGLNVSPPLTWSAPPSGTQSIALILEDLDRSFLHWLVFDLPPTQTSVDAGYAPGSAAVNDFGKQGYGGPCPPAGERHRYRFTVLALMGRNQITGTGTPGKPLERSLIQSGPVGRGELTGTYQRSGS
jgi:Raf kinase inhibitor-like YbhB/YbcL family protein